MSDKKPSAVEALLEHAEWFEQAFPGGAFTVARILKEQEKTNVSLVEIANRVLSEDQKTRYYKRVLGLIGPSSRPTLLKMAEIMQDEFYNNQGETK